MEGMFFLHKPVLFFNHKGTIIIKYCDVVDDDDDEVDDKLFAGLKTYILQCCCKGSLYVSTRKV